MVCHAGVYDWHAMLASDMVRGRFRALGTEPWGDLSIVDQQSAQRFAANFKTPTLVLHGEKDFRVPVTQGLAYYNTLRQKGVPTRLVYFPDENHWILKANITCFCGTRKSSAGWRNTPAEGRRSDHLEAGRLAPWKMDYDARRV